MGKRVLVVDDSRAMRAILGKMLKELGFEVVEAGDGRQGLDRLRESRGPGPGPEIDLALVDWNMPELDGYGLVCAVRADPTYDAVKLMMVTTEAESDRVTKALEAGANEYVMKPFTKEILIEKLAILGVEP